MHSFVVFALLGLAAALPSREILTPRVEAQTTDTYDYVIVGGGVTGLVVANRLSEDKKSEFKRRFVLRLTCMSIANVAIMQPPFLSLKLATTKFLTSNVCHLVCLVL